MSLRAVNASQSGCLYSISAFLMGQYTEYYISIEEYRKAQSWSSCLKHLILQKLNVHSKPNIILEVRIGQCFFQAGHKIKQQIR